MPDVASVDRTLQIVLARRQSARRLHAIVAILVLTAALWSAYGTEFNIPRLIEGLPKFFDLLRRMMPPDLSILPRLFWPMVETLEIALLGTTFALFFAVPLSFLTAANVTPHKLISASLRLVIGALRTVPELIWAMILVTAVGLGPFPGVIAIMLHTIGGLTKLYYEAVEATDPGLIEAMQTTGANRLRILLYGVLPSVFPVMMSNTLLYWEYNNRASTVLGLVGAGGIGLALTHALQDFRYPEVITCLILIVLILVVIDHLSAYLRARIV